MPDKISNINESLTAAKDLRENPAVRDALSMYLSGAAVSRHPELKDPNERLYFSSLLLNGMLRETDAATADRKSLNAFNPLGYALPEVDDVEGLKVLGAQLEEILPKAERDALTPLPVPEELGRAYVKKVKDAVAVWDKNELPADVRPIVETAIAEYTHCKKILNDELKAAHIGIPELGVDGGGGKNTLTRDQYLKLLTLVWNGDEGVMKDVIATSGRDMGKIDAALQREDIVNFTGSVMKMSADLSLETIGPGEKLRRFGVDLGPVIRHDYVEMRRGVDGKAIESADVWLRSPETGRDFLQTRLPATEGNERFKRALNFYIDRNWNPATPEELTAANIEGVGPDDTKLTLQLIVTALLESEDALKKSAAEREALKEWKGPGDALETRGAQIFEYMKDIRSHPIGSLALWGAALAAGKILYDIFRKRTGLGKWLLLGVGGAIGLGLYQQQTKGKAYWDDVLDHVKNAYRKEKAKPIESQSLPTMWAERLDQEARFYDGFVNFDRRHTKAVLSMLEQQKISKVLPWFEQMDTWEMNGGNMREVPDMPFDFSSRERLVFGDRPRREISVLMYRTMKSFFGDRGRMARQEHLGYVLPAGSEKKDDVGLGVAYIKERYLERKYFTRLVEGALAKVVVESDGTTVTAEELGTMSEAEVTDAIERVIAKRPDMRAVLDVVRVSYLAERVPVETADWEMWHIFMSETDPETWRRINGPGPMGGLLAEIMDNGKRIAADAAKAVEADAAGPGALPDGSPLPPEERAPDAPPAIPEEPLPVPPEEAAPGVPEPAPGVGEPPEAAPGVPEPAPGVVPPEAAPGVPEPAPGVVPPEAAPGVPEVVEPAPGVIPPEAAPGVPPEKVEPAPGVPDKPEAAPGVVPPEAAPGVPEVVEPAPGVPPEKVEPAPGVPETVEPAPGVIPPEAAPGVPPEKVEPAPGVPNPEVAPGVAPAKPEVEPAPAPKETPKKKLGSEKGFEGPIGPKK